jgi:hypothetical protein
MVRMSCSQASQSRTSLSRRATLLAAAAIVAFQASSAIAAEPKRGGTLTIGLAQ